MNGLVRGVLSTLLLATAALKFIHPDPSGWLPVVGQFGMGFVECAAACVLWTSWSRVVASLLVIAAVIGLVIAGVEALGGERCGCFGASAVDPRSHAIVAASIAALACALQPSWRRVRAKLSADAPMEVEVR